MKRWIADIVYNTENGPLVVTHDVDEIDELQNVVERGPSFETIEHVIVRYARNIERDKLTVEEAAKL